MIKLTDKQKEMMWEILKDQLKAHRKEEEYNDIYHVEGEFSDLVLNAYNVVVEFDAECIKIENVD